MKNEKSSLKEQKRSEVQRDNSVQYTNQVPFRYVPVKDPFERSGRSRFLKDKLYRVIKIK